MVFIALRYCTLQDILSILYLNNISVVLIDVFVVMEQQNLVNFSFILTTISCSCGLLHKKFCETKAISNTFLKWFVNGSQFY